MTGASISEIKFAPRTKFACIALSGCRGLCLPYVSTPNDRFVVLTRTPFDMAADWRDTLGSFRADRFNRSNLLIFASQASSDPFSRNAENDALIWSVRAFYYGLLMLGAPDFEAGLLLSGGVEDVHPHVLHVQDILRVFVRPVGQPSEVTSDLLREAEGISRGLLLVRNHESYQRLQRGFWTWVGAIRESHLHVRLHQFVRSVDALIASKPGKGRKYFVERGQTFAEGRNVAHILSQLYDLRSVEEHFSPWEPVIGLRTRQENERIGSVRSHQAERLAGHVYRRVLTSGELRDRFRNEETISTFWRLPQEQRRRIWADRLNLDATELEHP